MKIGELKEEKWKEKKDVLSEQKKRLQEIECLLEVDIKLYTICE